MEGVGGASRGRRGQHLIRRAGRLSVLLALGGSRRDSRGTRAGTSLAAERSSIASLPVRYPPLGTEPFDKPPCFFAGAHSPSIWVGVRALNTTP